MPRYLLSFLLLLSLSALGEPLQPATTLEAYRALSQTLQQRDRQAMTQELQAAGLDTPLPAPKANRFGFDPDRPVDFYRTPEGRRIAEIVLSYQTPSGGWSKRTDMSQAPRPPGGAFGVESKYIPTFDNSATTTQFELLVRAHAATGEQRYAEAAIRALRLMLLAQYPGGGWPQTFPLVGGYHDLITYNDAVTSNLLAAIAGAARGDLAFIDAELRESARWGLARGLQAVADTQVESDGLPGIWGAQHHPRTLLPARARAYEPAALATAESAELVLFLMSLKEPPEAIKQAIVAAHRWFTEHRIDGYRWEQKLREYSELVADPEAGPLWARFYEIDTHRPVFGDRDGSVHYDIDEISRERRLGYGWYTEKPARVLKAFPAWRQRHGVATP